MPMSIATSRELEELRGTSLFPLEVSGKTFPQILPFSQLYPSCCSNIRNFVNEYYMFSFENLQAQHDVDEILRKVSLYYA
jgi:exocyst complex component 6